MLCGLGRQDYRVIISVIRFPPVGRPADGAVAPPLVRGATSAGPQPSQTLGAAHPQQLPTRLHLLPGVIPRVQALLRDWRARTDADAVAASTGVPPPSELDGDSRAAGGDPAVVAGIAGLVVKASVPIDEPSAREIRVALAASAGAVPSQAVNENAIVRVLLGSLTLEALVRDVTASAPPLPPVPPAPLPRAPRTTSISLLADDPPLVPAVVHVKAEVLPRPPLAAVPLPRPSVAEVIDAPDAQSAAAAVAPRAVSAASVRAAVELPPPPALPLACTAESRAPTPPAPLHESAAGAGAARAGQKRPRELSGYPPAASASLVHASRRDPSRVQPPLATSGDDDDGGEGGTMPAARATSLEELPSAHLADGWVDVTVLRRRADASRRRLASEGRSALGFLLDGSDVAPQASADADAAAPGDSVVDEMLDAVIDGGGGGAAAAAPPKARRGAKAGKDTLDPATVAASRAVLASNRAARAAAVRARAAALYDPLPVQHLFDPDAAVVFDSGLVVEDSEHAGRGGSPGTPPHGGGDDDDLSGFASGPTRFSGRVPRGMERYYLGSSDGGAPSSTGPNTKRFRKVCGAMLLRSILLHLLCLRCLVAGGPSRLRCNYTPACCRWRRPHHRRCKHRCRQPTCSESLDVVRGSCLLCCFTWPYFTCPRPRQIQAEDARAAAENGDFASTNTVAGKKAAAASASAAARSSVAQRATRAGAGNVAPQREGRATAASTAAAALLPSYREAEISGDDSDDGEGYGTRATPAPSSSGRAAAKPADAAPAPHRASASSSVVRRRGVGGTGAAAAAPPPPSAAPPMGPPRSSGTGAAAGLSAAGERGGNASNSDDDVDMAGSRTAASAPTGMLATSARAKQQTLTGMLRQPPPAHPPATAAVVQKAPAGPRGASSSVARRR